MGAAKLRPNRATVGQADRLPWSSREANYRLMTDIAISGLCPPRFSPVREAFEANFEAGGELGARFCLAIEGEVVVDLMGGFADRGGARRFDADGFTEPMDPALWFDWPAICARLAAMSPLWPPGTASGYHPVTFGYIAGEIFRRVDGRTMGQALREDIAAPLGLDLWIGLPDEEHGRCAEVRKPTGLPALGPLDDIKRAAFLTPWASPGGRSTAEWRRAEIPSANGHATAQALARLAGALACDGRLDGVQVLAPGMAAQASAERIGGRDLVLPYEISWGAGFMRNVPNMVYGPGRQAFGHSGWGGSCVFADPERRVSGAYVMNRQSTELIGDARSRRLIDAAYAAL